MSLTDVAHVRHTVRITFYEHAFTLVLDGNRKLYACNYFSAVFLC